MNNIPSDIKKSALSRDLKPTIRIGKSGLTDNLVSEIVTQLAGKDVVKIKVNRGLFDKNDLQQLWEHLAESTNSTIVTLRGNVGVLWKR
jgi:RNA-binding protein YhbY